MVSYMPTRSCPAINIDFEKTVCLFEFPAFCTAELALSQFWADCTTNISEFEFPTTTVVALDFRHITPVSSVDLFGERRERGHCIDRADRLEYRFRRGGDVERDRLARIKRMYGIRDRRKHGNRQHQWRFTHRL